MSKAEGLRAICCLWSYMESKQTLNSLLWSRNPSISMGMFGETGRG